MFKIHILVRKKSLLQYRNRLSQLSEEKDSEIQVCQFELEEKKNQIMKVSFVLDSLYINK